jgi:hypothetical protein
MYIAPKKSLPNTYLDIIWMFFIVVFKFKVEGQIWKCDTCYTKWATPMDSN